MVDSIRILLEFDKLKPFFYNIEQYWTFISIESLFKCLYLCMVLQIHMLKNFNSWRNWPESRS